MNRAKILLGLAITIGVLATSAAPAVATWVALNGSTEGIFTSEVSTWNVGNGKTVTCQEDAGKWSIRKADKEQIKVSKGGHFNLLFTTFAVCTSNIGGEINEPTGGELQLTQGSGLPLKINTKVEKEVVLESKNGCVVKIPASSENSELAKTTVANQAKEQKATIELSGITTIANATCEAEGIKSGKITQFKSTETAKGVNVEEDVCTSGSGSALQTIPQQTWIGQDGVCIAYNQLIPTESDQALEEWGMLNTKELTPKDSSNGVKLDGYIGTDEPPTEANVKQGNTASGTNPITIPVMAAPIAVIFHPPAGCQIKVASWKVPNQELDLLFRHRIKFQEFLKQIGATDTGGPCEVEPTVEVRSDNSGSSLAFKQYLSQIKSSVWEKFVSDEPTWPAETQAKTTHIEKGMSVANKGNKGEALAVVETASSIGYVDVADAQSNGIKAWHNNQDKAFWGQVQNNGLESQTKAVEPVRIIASKSAGNCPKAKYIFAKEELEKKAEAKPPVWAGLYLANIKTIEAYPLCGFTYDVAWEKYMTANLEKAYGNHAEEVGNTVKTYLEFALGLVGQGLLEKAIPEFYSPLPENIDTISKEALKAVTP